jgi:hypothetical protein
MAPSSEKEKLSRSPGSLGRTANLPITGLGWSITKIVVVYQTLNYRKGVRPKGGPGEDFATDQSLLLARFTLEGKEIFRAPIVDRAADFKADNFPDHCLMWWNDRLLVSSGARSRQLHIREVTLNAEVLSDHVIPTRRNGIPLATACTRGRTGLVFFPAIRQVAAGLLP